MKDITTEITNMIQEYEDRIPAAVAESEVRVICQIIDDLDTLKAMAEANMAVEAFAAHFRLRM
jgi:uncharacterized protein YajQ (UPF0234 family)